MGSFDGTQAYAIIGEAKDGIKLIGPLFQSELDRRWALHEADLIIMINQAVNTGWPRIYAVQLQRLHSPIFNGLVTAVATDAVRLFNDSEAWHIDGSGTVHLLDNNSLQIGVSNWPAPSA